MTSKSIQLSRRRMLAAGAATVATARWGQSMGQESATAPIASVSTSDVDVLLPRNRVPVSFVIDDSTCLVNMGHFCNPQFANAWPDRDEYKQPWRDWPREIPDSFVREFGQWCADQGVKGKYSIVPYPACVGWLDRELPGWTRRELNASLDLVRELMVPNWDIHPEMITHTRVIDLKTGRPLDEISNATMENSYPQQKKSVDELAAYLAYALKILKNCGLPCEGITTPGGFGNAVKKELPVAVHQAVRDVFQTELPHYFKYVETGDRSTEPKLENLSGLGTDDVHVTANVLAGTGDWFGGWQGIRDVQSDRYLTPDGQHGRMAELIQRRQPAVMLCHWPGMYNNGSKTGFRAFQSIVQSIASIYGDQTIWMKLSEIGRYWTAKQLTTIKRQENTIELNAPFATSNFTMQTASEHRGTVLLRHRDQTTRLRRVRRTVDLNQNTFAQSDQTMTICLDLPKGDSRVMMMDDRG
ncbi:MAG: hypothetical protein HKN47_14090 [Pirellulaceae bacterium]|nr:hypothetical protein [Pirellulaceae bacterium]